METSGFTNPRSRHTKQTMSDLLFSFAPDLDRATVSTFIFTPVRDNQRPKPL